MDNLKDYTYEQLALMYMNGDNRAIDIILERCKSKLFSYILFMTDDYNLANDIFQDTFLKVIVTLREGRYQDNGKFLNWIFMIAHNLVIDHFRSADRKATLSIEHHETGEERFGYIDDSKETYIIRDQTESIMWQHVERLAPTQKEVVYMRYRQNLSFKEIAKITNVSINTSLGRMRYALLNLRRMMKTS